MSGARLTPLQRRILDGSTIAVDTRREILASKLAALLERSEIRDLVDVRALLHAGGDLESGRAWCGPIVSVDVDRAAR